MLRLFRFHSGRLLLRCPSFNKQAYRMASSLQGSVKMDSTTAAQTRVPDFSQNVVVMRHGERMDNFEPLWASTAARPWDPPLIEEGRVRAQKTGQRLRESLGFPIHRAFVSPFLRCVQTASEVVTALCAVDDNPDALAGDVVPIDPSKVKVSVEYGLCEMMNSRGIKPNVAPKDGNFHLDISQCEAILPAGTVDNKVERLYKELPQWEEPVLTTRARFAQIFKDLADKYPTENLLLITHGEGLEVALSAFMKDAQIYKVEYCAYVQLRRPIFQKGQSLTAGEFKVLTHTGQTGITYFRPNALTNDVS